LDQDFTKSGISSADHPDMSDSGKIQAKKSDGPMIEAQLDRLRSVDINIDSGKTQAAWVSIQSDAVVAIIIVRIVFIHSFLFYCLLLKHSFPTNPNKITNCFKLILSIYNLQGDASDDLMSLCKVYNGALIFRVYVGTVTSVPSITGK